MDNENDTADLIRPDPAFLAAYIKFQRESLHWKQVTLASMANVSLSTVERIERGEVVRDASLKKIALAFDLEPGAFTEPRRRLNENEAAARLQRSFAIFNDRIPATVAPFETEVQLRALAATHFAVLDTDLDEEAHDDLAGLREWIDLAAFMRPDKTGIFRNRPDRDFRARQLYSDVFEHVAAIEKKHRAVCLVGTYEAECEDPTYGPVPIALLCLRSKDRNPAAALIDQLWVERRMSVSEAIKADLEEEP